MHSDARPQGPLGEIVTFYSYKGGTGRSMLLANVAWQIAAAGRRVLLVDWDLEAPGLHRYFRPFLGDDVELHQQEGVIEWVSDYWDARIDEPDRPVAELVREFADPRHYVRKLDTGSLLAGGIDILCAGRQDRNYAKAVADFDWTRLFEKLEGEAFIRAAKDILTGTGGYDYILVDSRTGVSDTSGFCTVLLADTLVVCFTYNNQSVIGASQIARDIKQQAEQRRRDDVAAGRARRFRLFAVPSRVDDLDPERLDRRQRHAWSAFGDLLTDVAADQQPAYWLNVQVRNQGLFAYEEVLAACVNRPGDPQTVLGAVTQLTRWLTDDAFTEAPSLGDEQRRQLRLQFSDLANAGNTQDWQDAWQVFTQRMPEPGARDALLQACFPLLVQLYTVSGAPPGSDHAAPTSARSELLRNMVLENDLTLDERRMAEMLTSMGVTQRRITDDRQRGLVIADESILTHWSELATRLEEQLGLLALRQQIVQARRTWDLGGRTVSGLRAIQADLVDTDLSDEQRSWLGRPNLQVIHAVKDLRALDAGLRESQERLGTSEAEFTRRLAELQHRQDSLEAQRERRETELAASAEKLRHETARAERNTVRLRGAAITATALLAMLGTYAYFTSAQLAQARTDLNSDRAALAAAQTRLGEYEAERKKDAALRYYGEGTRKLLNIGKPTGRNYKQNIDSAVAAFSQAIDADPTLAEAFRGRALARGNLPLADRDISGELRDWAAYYDLLPSLNGRTQLIVRILGEPIPDEALLADQLTRLLADVRRDAITDTSPRRAAALLEAKTSSVPASQQARFREVIDHLKRK